MKQITLLPADTYKVVNRTILSDYDKKVIINLRSIRGSKYEKKHLWARISIGIIDNGHSNCD